VGARFKTGSVTASDHAAWKKEKSARRATLMQLKIGLCTQRAASLPQNQYKGLTKPRQGTRPSQLREKRKQVCGQKWKTLRDKAVRDPGQAAITTKSRVGLKT